MAIDAIITSTGETGVDSIRSAVHEQESGGIMEAHENELWSYLPESEMERRWSLAESLIGSTSEHIDSAARAVATLHNLIYLDGDEINLCANSPQWPFGGGGGSYWSMQLCDLGDITPEGVWLEGEAAELSTTPERFASLADLDQIELWAIMSANPKCPGALIDRLSRVDVTDYDHEQVRYCAAHNPGTPPDTLVWLADRDYTPDDDSDDEDDGLELDVRLAALANPAMPLESLQRWGQFLGHEAYSLGDGWQERAAVASNWGLTDALWETLAMDASVHVRAAVAGNPCAPGSLIDMLSVDADDRGFVQKAVLGNPVSSDLARAQASLANP